MMNEHKYIALALALGAAYLYWSRREGYSSYGGPGSEYAGHYPNGSLVVFSGQNFTGNSQTIGTGATTLAFPVASLIVPPGVTASFSRDIATPGTPITGPAQMDSTSSAWAAMTTVTVT